LKPVGKIDFNGPIPRGARATLQLFDPLKTDRLDHLAQSLDPLTEPGELVFGYAVMLRLCRAPDYAERA
jgi:hypothetical protein